MSISPATLYPFEVFKDFFSLSILVSKNHTEIVMKMNTRTVNTIDIPLTYSLLQTHLPSILRAQCFNDEGTPFYEEVKQTELGHLFEHILLEYLCMLKISSGYNRATFAGTTNWNWKKDPRGTFHIHLTAGVKDAHFFSDGLEKTMNLFEKIMESSVSLSLFSFSKTYPQDLSRL